MVDGDLEGLGYVTHGTLRHESGHLVDYGYGWLSTSDEWLQALKDMKMRTWGNWTNWARPNISEYSCDKMSEAFAESWAYFTSSLYGTETLPQFPEPLHRFFTTLTKRMANGRDVQTIMGKYRWGGSRRSVWGGKTRPEWMGTGELSS